MISKPNFWNFVTNLFLFSSHKHSSGAWGSFQPLQNSKNEIRGRKIQFMKKIAWIWTKYLKIIDFSYNLKKTIFLVWKVIFSICKNLNSSVFCGENFRKTSKGMFHSLARSNKPKLSKIRNCRIKIKLFSWISQKFACVRFPNCTHSLSYQKIGFISIENGS